jgi:hypothetical protein
MACFQVLSLNPYGGTEEYHGNVPVKVLCAGTEISTTKFRNTKQDCQLLCGDLVQNSVDKCKVPVPLTEHDPMKAYWGSGGIEPFFL